LFQKKGKKMESLPQPAEGTPAFEALEANRQHKVTQIDKHVKRHLKRPKAKHVIGSHKKEARKTRPNIKGKVIDGQHEQYLLTMGMMLGIRVSVARAKTDTSPLLVRDFGKIDKLVFPPKGCQVPGQVTPPHQLQHTFKFKDYAPRVFGAIREMFGVDSESYMWSVCGELNFIQFIAPWYIAFALFLFFKVL
jgi:1-phosphatidylinositol-4-phosphate 5-kinase